MGIDLDVAVHLLHECRKRGLRGSALTLGRQNCHFTFTQFMFAAGYVQDGKSAVISPEEGAVYEQFKTAGNMSDEFLFRFIGFDRFASVDEPTDNGAYGDARYAFDLNDTRLVDLIGEHDLVYEGGVIERIFNVPNVLRNMVEATRIGGMIVHHSPANNMVDRGFYQLSPTLFFDYYSANRFGDLEVYFCREFSGEYASKGHSEMMFRGGGPSRVRYRSGMLNTLSNGGLDSAVYSTSVYATKLPGSTWDQTPQQGCYVPLWAQFAT